MLTSTLNATTTYTIPAATAPCTKTVLPKAVTTHVDEVITIHKTKYFYSPTWTVETKTAVCTVPLRAARHDPYIRYQPKKFSPEVLKDPNYIHKARHQRRIVKRAPDAPTLTSTFSPAAVVTSTVAGSTITDFATVNATSTSFTYLAPSTIKDGTETITTTLPTPTRTIVDVHFTTDRATITRSFT